MRTDRPTDRPTDRQTDRQTDGPTKPPLKATSRRLNIHLYDNELYVDTLQAATDDSTNLNIGNVEYQRNIDLLILSCHCQASSLLLLVVSVCGINYKKSLIVYNCSHL